MIFTTAALKSFIFGPIGRWAAIGLGVALMLAVVHVRATYKERAACEARNAAAVAAEVKRQQKAYTEVVDLANARAAEAEQKAIELQERVNAYIESLADDADDCCGLTDNDVDRLRDILEERNGGGN